MSVTTAVFFVLFVIYKVGRILECQVSAERHARELQAENLENLQRQLAQFEAQSNAKLTADCARLRRAATEGK